MATQFGALFQLFFLRLVVFFVCFTVFTYLVRGEIAERSLHFYLMAPLRRDVFLVGKFIAGLIAASIIVPREPRDAAPAGVRRRRDRGRRRVSLRWARRRPRRDRTRW